MMMTLLRKSIDNSQIDSTKNPNAVINEENANEKDKMKWKKHQIIMKVNHFHLH